MAKWKSHKTPIVFCVLHDGVHCVISSVENGERACNLPSSHVALGHFNWTFFTISSLYTILKGQRPSQTPESGTDWQPSRPTFSARPVD